MRSFGEVVCKCTQDAAARHASFPPVQAFAETIVQESHADCAAASGFARGVLSLKSAVKTRISTADIAAGTSQMRDQACVAPSLV
jgi:hypothetical protein